MNGHLQNQLTKSLERILEEAHLSGELKLSGRKLKDFPKTGGKYDLSDTVIADLSKNKFWELPSEVLEFLFIEKLHLYHNALRSLPDGLGSLQYLKFLDLSRNQLCALPSGLCQLEYLEVLLVANNKLSALPNDIGGMKNLMELNASCNEITHLPRSLGQLKYLKALDLRKNLLEELPIELTYLKLTLLDMSENRISSLPVELRLMTNLEQLKLNDNPLVSPPATTCMRGRVHIFKSLETQVHKTDKKRCGTLEDVKRTQRKSDVRYPSGVTSEMRVKRHTVDSGYSTSDGMDTKWTQDYRYGENVNKTKLKSDNIPITNGEFQESVNGTFSGYSTPSTISPGESVNNDDELINKTILYQDQMEAKRLIRLQSNDRGPYPSRMKENIRPNKVVTNGEVGSLVPEISSAVNGNSNGEEKKRLEHVQTYREYKEARRLQRAQTQDVYRSKYSGEGQVSNQSPTTENSKFEAEFNGVNNNHQCNDSTLPSNKKPVQKVIPSRNTNYTISLSNGDANHIPSYVKPSSPIKGSTSLLGECSPKPTTSPLSARLTTGSSSLSSSLTRFRTNPNSSRPTKWNADIPADKLSFTMRREFEKAKEEAELIEQLRHHIESRLKMSLPDDMGPALMDGVVLCHLANHVRPRSVASIHVPSPAVHGDDNTQMPKLTMARCRRNVDNFLDACRKIGVEEEDLCSCEDVVETLRVGELLRTVEALLLVTGTILPPPKPADVKVDNVSTVLCLAGLDKMGLQPDNLICFASDVLEGRGLVRVSITVAELLKFHTPKSPAHTTITAP